MSIINEALKKAAKKRSYLLDFASESARGANQLLRLDIQQRIWQKKKWLLFSGIGGSLLISAVVLAIFFGRNLLAPDLYLQKDAQDLISVKESAPVVRETRLLRPALPIVESRKKFVKLPNLDLSGIMQGRGKPLAIINDRVVNAGDTIRGATVIRINKDSVNLIYQDQEFVLRLK